MDDDFTFPHETLDAWRYAVRARVFTHKLLKEVPRGFGDDVRQARKSSQAVSKLVAEGANRWSRGFKRQRYEEALGEIGETVSGLSELVMLGALERDAVVEARRLWWRARQATLGLFLALR